MGKAVSVNAVMTKKFNRLEFENEWLASFGKPVFGGSWIIWSKSGSGKTRFTLMLSKYFAGFGRVIYNSLEEGFSPTVQTAFREVGMDEVKRKLILTQESIPELTERLSKKKSPQIAIIDSVQYTGINYREYTCFKDSFPNKTLIFLSHARGKEPAGNTAERIRYDAHVKIYIEGYVAFPTSRFGGNKPFIIWDQGAKEYWGLDFDEIVNDRYEK